MATKKVNTTKVSKATKVTKKPQKSKTQREKILESPTSFLKGAINDSGTTVLTSLYDSSVDSDFEIQVSECRNLTRNGSGRGVVPRIIESMVQSATGSNVDKYIHYPKKMKRVEKKLFEEFIKKLNSGNKDILPGLLSFNEWWFRELWTSSLVCSYWTYGDDTGNIPLKMIVRNPKIIRIKYDRSLEEFKYYEDMTCDYDDETLYDKNTTETKRLSLATFNKSKWQDVDTNEFRLLPLQTHHDMYIEKRGCQPYDIYPVPYLVSVGVVGLCKLKEALRNSDLSLARGLIKAILQFKKGSDALTKVGRYVTPEQITEYLARITAALSPNSPSVLASSYDESAAWVQPNMEGLNPQKYEEVDKDILEALGLVEIVEASRGKREAVLNPKPLMLEIRHAANKHAAFINYLFELIKEKNGLTTRPQYIPMITDVWLTPEGKALIAKLYTYGLLSKTYTLESLTTTELETERERRKDESTKNDMTVMYPPVINNQEQHPDPGGDQDGRPANEPKLEPKKNEKKLLAVKDLEEIRPCLGCIQYLAETDGCISNCDINAARDTGKCLVAIYEEAPYKQISELPDSVKVLPEAGQRMFLKAFNSALAYYKSEETAFKVAWSQVKKYYIKLDKVWTKRKIK